VTTDEFVTQVLNLQETELLVLHVPDTYDNVALANLRRQLVGLIPIEVQNRASIAVLRGGMRIETLSDADLKRLGLQRIP